MNTLPSFFRLRFLCACVIASLCFSTGFCAEEFQTITDAQGREIQVELVSLRGDQLTVKRDDGKEFTIPLSGLHMASQRMVRRWAEAESLRAAPGALTLNKGRTKMNTIKRGSTSTTTITDEWSFWMEVNNVTPDPIVDVRVEYVLFAKEKMSLKVSRAYAGMKRKEGTKHLGKLPPKSKTEFKTDTIDVERKENSKGTVTVRDELYGI